MGIYLPAAVEEKIGDDETRGHLHNGGAIADVRQFGIQIGGGEIVPVVPAGME